MDNDNNDLFVLQHNKFNNIRRHVFICMYVWNLKASEWPRSEIFQHLNMIKTAEKHLLYCTTLSNHKSARCRNANNFTKFTCNTALQRSDGSKQINLKTKGQFGKDQVPNIWLTHTLFIIVISSQVIMPWDNAQDELNLNSKQYFKRPAPISPDWRWEGYKKAFKLQNGKVNFDAISSPPK